MTCAAGEVLGWSQTDERAGGDIIMLLKTRKVILALALIPLLGLMAVSQAEATPISGAIFFSGTATLEGGNYNAATGIDFNNPVDIFEGISTGDYSGLDASTQATFADLTGGNSFGAPGTTGGLSVSPFWSFTDVGTGLTYTFNLLSVTHNGTSGGSRVVGGSGVALITGGSSSFDPTPGAWELNTQGPGATISFQSITSVPDGGWTVAMLGSALLAIGLLRRRLGVR
jgi:hypothetical protein